MPSSYEVTCVSRSAAGGASALHVTHLGGQNPLGRTWRISLKEAIDGIIDGRWSLFITVGGVRRNLVVAVTPEGSKILKTELDGARLDVLLSLPDCHGNDEVK